MTLSSITATQLINAPPITPGIAGWHTIIDGNLRDLRAGRFNLGLLSRLANTAVSSTGAGTVVLEVPPGYQACVTTVLAQLATASTAGTYDMGIGTGAPTNWRSNVNLVALNNLIEIAQILPLVGASSPVSASPAIFTSMDGDVASRKEFRIFHDTGTNPLMNWFILGHLWPKIDPAS